MIFWFKDESIEIMDASICDCVKQHVENQWEKEDDGQMDRHCNYRSDCKV